MNDQQTIAVSKKRSDGADYYRRSCDTCNKDYVGRGKYYCSPACQPRGKHKQGSKALITGKDHPCWKDEVGYHGVHDWVRRTHGSASICENPQCTVKNPKRYEWALVTGKSHKKNIENYWQLCKKCHIEYDGVKRGEDSHLWRGGKPKCLECKKLLSSYSAERCRPCNSRVNSNLPRLKCKMI
jgi:hypothetical protein